MSKEAPVKEIKGGRNLVILGILAVSFAVVTTGIELWVYRSTGDIYLDRSRPGFLPDAEEVEEDTPAESGYSYTDYGEITTEGLQEYIEELQKVQETINKVSDPYNSEPISDKSLGISK